MEIIKAMIAALLLLLLGDFFSTFLYHVPEHVFGRFHTIVHHGKNRSFLHYAVLTRNPLVVIDGILGAIPYFIFTPCLWQLSPIGTSIGLLFGEFHVVWRHVSILQWQTPKPIEFICNLLFITTPERHWQHHRNAFAAYGDIFTFLDPPAQKWLIFLRFIRRKSKQNIQLLATE
ncbi:sterol desaturase [Chamaesiphon sp. VAR_48_metabat_135_sub]|uniref:sterol desaturase n=1 Tax=Chamaesiphon sp. VAR_48_metabat_135_sub TaxID=2964699 RepID=UPI00286B6E62|nr:sterol desaturase [Chamaesiphon sp. VAR_48_metabat_135_sub]